jgi:hypothetical protein
MGRPIKKKFFGNLNREYYGSVFRGSGVGGEGVASSIIVANSGTLYSLGATLAFSAPDIAGGATATGTPTISQPGAGGITAITLTNSGSGYNSSTATITVTKPATVNPTATAVSGNYTLTNLSSVAGIYVGMRIDGSPGVQASSYVVSVNGTNVTLSKTMTASTSTNPYAFSDQGSGFQARTSLTTSVLNAITIISYLTTGSSAISGGDIIKQESSRRYLVKNAQGTGQCALSTGTLTAGKMHIIATDYKGSTYWVTKLTANKARLYNRTSTSTAVFSVGQVAKWTLANTSTFTGASTLTNVSISHTL